MALSKETRQEIVREFALRHNGTYNPKLFIDEVRRVGAEHPAFDWFEWNREKAAYEHQLWQAREFARDLRVIFTVEEVGRKNAVRVREVAMPLVMSPTAGRADGGGYVLSDPNDPEHMAEHCRQAAAALRTWFNRYEAALIHSGGSVADVEKAISRLDSVSPQLAAAE